MNQNNNKNVRSKSNPKQIPSPRPFVKSPLPSRKQNPPLPRTNTNLNTPKIKETPPQLSSLVTINQLSESKHSQNSSSSLTCSDIQRQQLLKLEIKQLKRQNLFLKKKIQELNQEKSQPMNRKRPRVNKADHEPHVQSLHLSVNYFFKEIEGLIKSVTKLFHLDSYSHL